MVYGDSTLVRIYDGLREIALHQRVEHPWQIRVKSEHAPPYLEEYLSSSRNGLLRWAHRLAAPVGKLAEAIFSDKAVDGTRPVRGLIRLADTYGVERLAAACRRALLYELPHYRSVKQILAKGLDQLPLSQPATTDGQLEFRFQRDYGYFDPSRHIGERSTTMESMPLQPKLTRLKLSGILETLEHRLDQAKNEKWSYSQFLDLLLADEVERRDHKQLVRRLSRSGLDPEKTIETFDFSFNPKIHEPTIRELAQCQFIAKNENLLFLGSSGVGKSHLAQAIGNEAVRRGYEVLYRRTSTLFGWVASGEGDGSREKRLRMLAVVPLLILDDFGMKPLDDGQQSDLYELICERYEKAPTILTSNRDFNEWPMIFHNPLMGSAAMDRLVHRTAKLLVDGKSYRVESFVQRTRAMAAETQSETNEK